MPGIRALAAGAGVSPVTMGKAVHVLAARGRLRTVPERQIVVVPPEAGRGGGAGAAATDRGLPPPPPPAPPPAIPRWRELKDRVASDLLALRLGPGPDLPSAKELCARYGVARLTLGRALRALASEGRLLRAGRGFRRRGHAVRAGEAIVFLAEQPGGDVLTDLSPRSLELWRALEASCRRRGLRLDSRPVAECLARGRGGPPRGPDVVGYVVRNLDVPAATAGALLARLAALQRPVALVDEVGLPQGAAWARRASRFRVFAIAHSERAGRDVGEALLELGHRHVAVFSPFRDEWSRSRVRGLADALLPAGPRGGVRAYVLPRFAGDAAVRDAVAGARGYAALVRRTVAFRDGLDPGRRPDDPARDASFRAFAADAVAGSLRPLFARALAEGRASAWVGVNDTVALAALRFLREAGRRVPRDAAVVGFDDTAEALRGGLASYDFNLAGLAEALVDHVLGWRSRSGRDRAPVVEIPGGLVARDSLGPAPAEGGAGPRRFAGDDEALAPAEA